MVNNILFKIIDENNYTLEVSMQCSNFQYTNSELYLIRIYDICNMVIFETKLHYDIIIHLLYNDLNSLFEFNVPFVLNCPIINTVYSDKISGYDSGMDNIVIVFEREDILDKKCIKYIKLEFDVDNIYKLITSDEIFTLLYA